MAPRRFDPKALVILSLVSILSCSLVPDPRPAHRLVLAEWNVENLFDEVHDGGEYAEFDPEKGWTRAQFWHRCEGLARVIRTLGDRGPDILVLEEVEGAHALQVLNERFLGDLDYRYTFLASPSVPGIKTVFLSRFPLVRTGLLFPASAADEVSRPIVEAEFSLGTRELVVLANHWKSRIPSPKATEPARSEAARTLSRRLVDLDAREDHPFVVAVGDFNTSLELSRPWPERALVSGGVAAASEAALVVFPGRTAAARSSRPGAVWDPWETVSTPAGSYYYQGDWDRLDHTFVAVSSLKASDWGFESFRVADYAARPQAYGVQNPNGISDHFPLVLTLARKGT